jgi:hypothetical protein
MILGTTWRERSSHATGIPARPEGREPSIARRPVTQSESEYASATNSCASRRASSAACSS